MLGSTWTVQGIIFHFCIYPKIQPTIFVQRIKRKVAKLIQEESYIDFIKFLINSSGWLMKIPSLLVSERFYRVAKKYCGAGSVFANMFVQVM